MVENVSSDSIYIFDERGKKGKEHENPDIPYGFLRHLIIYSILNSHSGTRTHELFDLYPNEDSNEFSIIPECSVCV